MAKRAGSTLIAASAVAGLMALGTAGISTQAQTAGNGDVVRCYGINKCKGTGDCGGKGHSCAGENSCKGHGYLKMKKETCLKIQGGRLTPDPERS